MITVGRSRIAQAVLLCVALGFLVYAAVNCYSIVVYPYQHEFREGTPLVVVKTMLDRHNPYSLRTQPAATYVYGILYPLLNYPISWAFGATMLNARIMSWLYVWLTALLVFRFCYLRSRNVAIAALCTVPFYYPEVAKALAVPPDLGILLLVASVLIAYEGKFSPRSLALSAACSVAGYYTKPFFMVGIGYVATYLFVFRSKRTALRFFGLAMAAWVGSLALVHRWLPAYLNDCFLHHVAVAEYSRHHVYEQLRTYGSRELFLLMVVLALVVAALRRIRLERVRVDVLHPDQPLLNGVSVSLFFELSVLVIGVLFFYKLGGHPGAWEGAYLYYLCSPVLVLVVAEKFTSLSTPRWLQYVSAIGLVAYMGASGKRQHQMAKSAREHAKTVAVLEQAMARKQKVMNCEFTASIAVAQDRTIYESGQSQYFITGNTRLGQLIYGDAIVQAQQRHLNEIQRQIEAKAFDLVMVATGWYLPASFRELYQKTATYQYPGILDGCGIEFWERK